MKFSIITVCYNSAATVEQTIQSVLSQTYKNIEYIVIDGNSTDQSSIIFDKYKSQFGYFISEPDKGIYDAMNKGLRAATGDIVGILNSDDLYKSDDVIEKVAALFDNVTDAVCTNIDIFNNTTDNVIRHYSCTRWKPWMFRIGHQPPHPGFFVRRDCYEKYGLFNTQYKTAADFDMMLRLIYKHKIRVVYSNITTVCMRSGGASQRSLKAIAKANKEDHISLKSNGYFSLYPIIWLKYLLKIFQFR